MIDHHFYKYNFSIGILGLIFLLPASILAVYSVDYLSNFFRKVKERPRRKSRKQRDFKSKGREPQIQAEHTYQAKQVPKRNWTRIFFRALGKVLLFFVKLLHRTTSAFTRNIESTFSRSVYGWMRNIEDSIDESYRHSQRKKDANWRAHQKQKEADHAWRQAANQGNYNMNTHHFNQRLNEAKRKQEEANRARKEARR